MVFFYIVLNASFSCHDEDILVFGEPCYLPAGVNRVRGGTEGFILRVGVFYWVNHVY